MSKIIYFDNASTTKVDEKVLKEMTGFFTTKYGNASSMHSFGLETKQALEKSRDIIANSINADPEEIIFTSGGTESNNLALKGIVFANKNNNKHIITTKIEHDCVLNTCKWLERTGVKVTYLNVDKQGFVNLQELKKAITKDTILISVIHANNETGVIQNLKEIGKICEQKKIYFHTDACQSYTKTEINVKKQNLDLVTINSHKIHGPKGVGALYIKKGTKITPLAHGGGHEFNLRSGTENISGIVGFACAVKIALKPSNIKYLEKLRKRFIKGILEIPHVKINGPQLNSPEQARLCNIININFKNIEGESIGSYLDSYDICVSTGSACSSKTLEPSHVLKAMNVSHLEINSSIRISLSRFNTLQEIEYFLKVMPKIVETLREISPFKLPEITVKQNLKQSK